MATTFKNFLSNDIANTRTLLHEAIPITGSIISGTYGTDATLLGNENHIKTYVRHSRHEHSKRKENKHL